LVEIEQHCGFPIAPPGFDLRQIAGRVDDLNGIDSLKLCDNFDPGTASCAQNQDPWFVLVLFLNRHAGILLVVERTFP
jgi:hypothetical protein